MRLALSQVGLPYVFGHEELPTDPTPEAFDCSEEIEWIDHRVGPGTMPDGSMNQLAYYQREKTIIPLEKALRTRGAILVRHISVLGVGHTEISLGNGKSTGARGSAYGTGIFPSDPKLRLWTHGALWPGFDYDTPEPEPEMVLRLVVFGPLGGRWGHVNISEGFSEQKRLGLTRLIEEFYEKFPQRPALVVKRREPKDLDDIKPGEYPKWLAAKHGGPK